MVETTEREMVRRPAESVPEERESSLQATYEDSVAPDEDGDWELEES